MPKSTVDPMQSSIGARLMPRRHTAMLSSIVALFAVRPLIGDGPVAEILYTLALMVLMIFALYAIQVAELVGEQAALRAEDAAPA